MAANQLQAVGGCHTASQMQAWDLRGTRGCRIILAGCASPSSFCNPQITRHLVSRGPVVAAGLSEPDVGKPLHAITMVYVMWLKGLVILATGAIAEAAFAPAPAPAGELPLCPSTRYVAGHSLSHSEWPVTA